MGKITDSNLKRNGPLQGNGGEVTNKIEKLYKILDCPESSKFFLQMQISAVSFYCLKIIIFEQNDKTVNTKMFDLVFIEISNLQFRHFIYLKKKKDNDTENYKTHLHK